MKRRTYNQDRATLDPDSYREGFLGGYGSGAEAAIEYLSTGYFAEAYEDHFYPEPPGPGLWATGSTPPNDTAYRIGYSDAFDLGYQNTLEVVNKALKVISTREGEQWESEEGNPV